MIYIPFFFPAKCPWRLTELGFLEELTASSPLFTFFRRFLGIGLHTDGVYGTLNLKFGEKGGKLKSRRKMDGWNMEYMDIRRLILYPQLVLSLPISQAFDLI